MKKLILFVLLMVPATGILADEVPTMNIVTDNQTVSLQISDIRKVTFPDDNMVVILNTSSQESFAMAKISSVELLNMPVKEDTQDLENVNNESRSTARKIMIDGVIYIEKDGQRFSILGTRL